MVGAWGIEMALVRLTENFTLDELACHDGTPVPEELIPNAQRLCDNVQKARWFANAPFEVISGYRTKEHNLRCGGAPKSLHLQALAMDILPPDGMTAGDLLYVFEGLIRCGAISEGGLGYYPEKDFLHYDPRGKRRRWRG